jgi:hypothetical protein
MTTKDFRQLIENGEFHPFIIRTAGRDYVITDPATVWIPPSYQSLAILAPPGKGVVLLDIRAVEAIHLETAIP